MADAPFKWTTRRIVTADSRSGRSRIIEDGEPTDILHLNGCRITRLWQTDQVPEHLPVEKDPTEAGLPRLTADFSGTRFYTAELPAGEHAPRIPMHRTDTVDYIAVLSGELWLVLDDDEQLMKAGDTLVQAGAHHTWQNRGSDPAVLLVVVVAARPAEG